MASAAMSDFLRALGYDPSRYWILAGAAFALWLAAGLLPSFPAAASWRRLGSTPVVALLLLAAMAAFRWPAIIGYKPVNPDEAQFLAGALTMVARGEFWWPDGMSSGPLVMAPLALPALVGLPVDFASGRVVVLLLSWGIVLFTGLALRHVHGDRLARWLVLPLACFMVFLDFWDFAAYASEWLPLFLCTLAAWLALTAFDGTGRLQSRWRLAGTGAVLGALPFSKLQILPLGVALAVVAAFLTGVQPGADRRRIRRDLLALAWPALAVFGAFAVAAALSGNLPHLRQAYVGHNLFYAQSRAVPWTESFGELRYLVGFSWGFTSFFYGTLILCAVGTLAWTRLPRPAWRPPLLGGTLLVAAACAVLAPGRAYPHYLLLLTAPLALIAGLQFGDLLRGPRLARGWLALLVAVGVGAQVAELLLVDRPLTRLVPEPHAREAIVDALRGLRRPGDTLAVWGWRPELYVETRLPQAVRDAHTERQMHDSPQQDYFRERFLADVRESKPAFLVDAVGRGGFLYQDRANAGLERFPALADYVGRNYRLLGEFDTFRLYVRLDRAPR